MKNDLINGRTPEEIKAGLKACTTAKVPGYGCNIPCPYLNTPNCWLPVKSDALALIEHLEAERDAALAKVPKWISVKDSKKPRHGQECLCICAMENDPKHEWDYQMVLKWYAYGSNGLVDRPHFQHEGCEGMTVTHWAPLLPNPANNE